MSYGKKKEEARGMVLIFTLCILAILAILGATIFLSVKDNMQTSTDLRISRDAFLKADMTSRMAIFLARASNAPDTGSLSDTIKIGGVSGEPQYSVELNNFTISGFGDFDEGKVTNEMLKNHHLVAMLADSANPPQLNVFYEYSSSSRQLVATASVARAAVQSGAGEGEGSAPVIYYFVTADGRIPTLGQGSAGAPEDPSNYFAGDVNAKHCIITSIYRDIAY